MPGLSEDTQSTKEMRHEMNAFIEKLNKVSIGDAKEPFVNLPLSIYKFSVKV